MEIILIAIGLIIGGVSIWFVQKFRVESKCVPKEYAKGLEGQINQLKLEDATKSERLSALGSELKITKESLATIQKIETELREKIAREETERLNSERRVEEQRKEFENSKERLKIEFKELSNSIFEEKTQKFTVQNKDNLNAILKPLGDNIKEFKTKVEDSHKSQIRDGAELREQIKNLTQLNLQMSEEANNLTSALKGQNKTMGNWGELVLETLLESSGLNKGVEYIVQESFRTEGGRQQPDVIVNLPDNKHLVIDSKVSLVSYEQYFSSTEDNKTKDRYLKSHVTSIRKHIKDLSEKNYQDLYQISAPDFVMMFMPIDSALIIAFQSDRDLFMDAYNKGIYLVSPLLLLFSLRTIANLWKGEKQNKNAMNIAIRGGALYDKFVGFYEELQKLGACIDNTRKCYDDSLTKLKTGRGSLLRQVEMLKDLGARTNKFLPEVDDTLSLDAIAEE